MLSYTPLRLHGGGFEGGGRMAWWNVPLNTSSVVSSNRSRLWHGQDCMQLVTVRSALSKGGARWPGSSTANASTPRMPQENSPSFPDSPHFPSLLTSKQPVLEWVEGTQSCFINRKMTGDRMANKALCLLEGARQCLRRNPVAPPSRGQFFIEPRACPSPNPSTDHNQ